MPIYEGNTVEEAINKGLHSLNLALDEVSVTVQSETKKGFFGFGRVLAKVSVESTQPPVELDIATDGSQAVTTDREIPEKTTSIINEVSEQEETLESAEKNKVHYLTNEKALDELTTYLRAITSELHVTTTVRVEQHEQWYMFHLDTDQQGKLIGKHGKTLNALQYLAQVFIHRIAINKLSVVVNVGHYREKREQVLQQLAQKTAERVKKTGTPVSLEPMPAFERKHIHFELGKNPSIHTYSKGAEPNRYLVVELAEKNE